MLRSARLAPVIVAVLLGLVLALGYAMAQTNTPAAPAIASLTAGDTTLTVTWTAPAGETGITAYDVRHIQTSADETVDANWTVEDNAWTSGTLEYTITTLTNGTQYDVQVRAVNSIGDGTWSATEVATPALPAPTMDTVRGDDRAIYVAWSAPSGTATGIKAYDVRYIETSGDESVDSNWTVEEDAWEDGGGSLYYAITGLTNDTEYDVQARSVDEDDIDGAWSTTTSATPEDHVDTRTVSTATPVNAGDRVWGAIDSPDDEDYFLLNLPAEGTNFWIYTLGNVDTVGVLMNSDGETIESDDYGSVLPNPDNFFIWSKLQHLTYFIKVTGYGDADEPYVLRVRAFPERTGWPTADPLPIDGFASGTIDPENDYDFFRLSLSTTTEIAIRSSGFPDTVGELYTSRSSNVASNDDGYLPGGWRNFLIRTRLEAGTYFLNVSSFDDASDGPFTVYATAIVEPGSTTTDALPLTLGGVGGGMIDPGGDEDYFSLTLDERTHVIVGGVGRSTDLDAELFDSNNVRAPIDSVHFASRFVFQGTLDAGTYYLKVTGKDATETGRYTVRAIVEGSYTYFENRCTSISRSSGINDPLYGCQWYLNNDDQFRNSAGYDIKVEEVWPTYTGSGITVAVVDDGMHYTHEDLKDNVDVARNHDYGTGGTDIYDYFDWHGTAVAGLIAAKDNGLGIRGVAPEATIYGYNYLEYGSDANRADAMYRNATTTAVSNNSWGPRDYGEPNHVNELWERAVERGVTDGYGGKGVSYVWSAGNGGEDDDDSNLDEIANFYAVTAVCAVGHDDKRSSYSEPGVNLWVCGPSSSGRVGQPGIATTDNGHRYWGRFGGTSAAAPIVSGVIALVREANNALTWRDVKLILAASARKNDADNTGWEQGALKYRSTTERYNFNHEYGFGMVDAKAATDLAAGWTNAPKFREITVNSAVINLRISDAPSSGTPTAATTTLTIDPYVGFIEFVEVNTHFNHSSFRDLSVELVSPSGAVSVLVPSGPVDARLTSPFRFGSARHLGEDAAGEWTLRIKDEHRGSSGTLRSWGLTFYGHGYIPGAPAVATTTPGGGTLTVQWDVPTDTGASAITSYDLRHIRDDAADKSDDKWTLATGVGTLTDRSHTIRGLEGGVKYAYQVRAHNSAGHGPWSESGGEEPTTVKPSEPSITDVTRGDRTLAVVWTEPTDNGGGRITAYDVRYIETSADETVDSNWTVRDNAWRSGDLLYVIRNLTNAIEYDVQVRAVNRAGNGEWSDTVTGTPLPDDIPISMQWEQATLGVDEDAGSVVLRAIFTTTLNAPPESDFEFALVISTTDLGATVYADYTPPPTSTSFTAGDFSMTTVNGEQRYRATRDFTVAIADDTTDESDEDFRVTMNYRSAGLSHLQGGPQSATITVTDNDHVPVTIAWERTDVTTGENAGTVTLRATALTAKDKVPDDGFTFDASISSSDGGATQPGDYTRVSETVTFVKSDFSRATVGGRRTYRAVKQINVTIVDDTEDEPDESFDVLLAYSNPGPLYLLGGPATTTVTITDNDQVPVTISFEETSFVVDEDVGSVTLTAVAVTTKDKMPESGFAFGVSVSTAEGTAAQTEDFGRLHTTASFRRSDFQAADVNGQQRYRATREFTVRIVDDTDDEPDEEFTVGLAYSNPALPHLQGGSATAFFTITDNDHVPVVLGWEQIAFTAEEGTTVTLTAVAVTTKDKIPESGSTFDFTASTANGSARQPGDYAPLSETVTFSPSDFSSEFVNGQPRYRASRTFTVSIPSDNIHESNENFTVNLAFSGPAQPHLSLGDRRATVTVVDDLSTTVDLSLQGFGLAFQVSRGDELVYDYTVSNSGPATSTNTTVVTTLDRGLNFVAATSTAACTRSGRTVRCRFGTLGAGDAASAMIAVQVASSASADIAIASVASANELDQAPANNTDTVTAELDAPPQPITNLRATGAAAHVDLSWSRPADNGSPITAYVLERKEGAGDYVTLSSPPGVSATTYRDDQVTVDTTYTYRLFAVNDDGDAEPSNEASATPGAPPPPPPRQQTTVGGGGPPPPPPPPPPPATPRILFAPETVSFEAVEGGDAPEAQTLEVRNREDVRMAFDVSDDADWLALSPTSGVSDGPDDEVEISVTADVSGLTPGTYTGTIEISGSGIDNSPQSVSVTLVVRSTSYARQLVVPGERTEIVTPDSTVALIVPENAVSSEVEIRIERLDGESQPEPRGEWDRLVFALDLSTFAPGGTTRRPTTYRPGVELRLLVPEEDASSCDAGRVKVYRVFFTEWRPLPHSCETDDEGRVWAVTTLTRFSTYALVIDDSPPAGSICWSVSNILSWRTCSGSGWTFRAGERVRSGMDRGVVVWPGGY